MAILLERIDGRGYKAYRELEGATAFSDFTLYVDRAQSDPFASPSKVRIRVPADVARLPSSCQTNPTRRVAASAALARRFRDAIRYAAPRREGTGKSGLIEIDAGGQEVLERTAIRLEPDFVEARIEIGLPANGRRVRGRAAETLLLETLPRIVRRAFTEQRETESAALVHFVDCIENQEFVRTILQERGWIAFVGNGACLPRESGASDRPMPADRVVPFAAPPGFEVSIDVPHSDAGAPGRQWTGMAIPEGVTLLVGGGYHGKSTLLRAIERSVVPHVPGDGRDTVVSRADLVKIRAEDGRSVCGVDLRPFIDRLPKLPGETEARGTESFSTAEASGSTSQAANIIEAIEAGARGLLLDEDTSATNFMVRDARMQALVHPKDEPITPFRDRVRELYEQQGISTLLVMGGSGDYFEVADTVLELRDYSVSDVTQRAHQIAREADCEPAEPSALQPIGSPAARIPDPQSLDPRRGRTPSKISSRGCEELVFGTTVVDLRAVEQLFDPSQTRAIAQILDQARQRFMGPGVGIEEILDGLQVWIDDQGLDALAPYREDWKSERHPGAFARPRRFEIAAALNRMRSLRLLD